ncbi:outer membrane protein TolC [Flavobacterium sp. 270]|uniref:TolC family protein n=1 Tax=Flavobacterium sp. 270 TaxID=2512114 RepID=UPI0010CE61E7|nr:TolC family protein [Flavobacterium sp. 270]TDW51766.1 outer membrane protein TolC [Flavobacterium sp. 270]
MTTLEIYLKPDEKGKGFDQLIWSLVFALAMLFFLANPFTTTAQIAPENSYKLTLTEAIQFAKKQNKWVKAVGIEEMAVAEDRKDVQNAALPSITVGSSYQRFSDVTLFSDGLSHAATSPRKPTATVGALGVDALFTIYGGGKHRALQAEQNLRLNLAKLNSQDLSGNISLQTASQYLDLVRFNEQQKFILDQVKRAQTRLNNINSLYKNQKVTKSDVLRAEVALSNAELSLMQNENDIAISNQKLDVLINVPDSVMIFPADSAGMAKPEIGSLMPYIETAGISSFSIQKAAKNVEIQRARLRGIQSNNLPSLSFYSNYGFNYPYAAINQTYAVGFVGLKLQYSISSLYQNNNKVAAGKLRVNELEVQQDAHRDDVQAEITSFYIKYGEALKRITVNERSVEQASVNYKIVNTKYLNQLSLLTDLLDADNLYQESRFHLVQAQTDALVIYYRILYTSGNL